MDSYPIPFSKSFISKLRQERRFRPSVILFPGKIFVAVFFPGKSETFRFVGSKTHRVFPDTRINLYVRNLKCPKHTFDDPKAFTKIEHGRDSLAWHRVNTLYRGKSDFTRRRRVEKSRQSVRVDVFLFVFIERQRHVAYNNAGQRTIKCDRSKIPRINSDYTLHDFVLPLDRLLEHSFDNHVNQLENNDTYDKRAAKHNQVCNNLTHEPRSPFHIVHSKYQCFSLQARHHIRGTRHAPRNQSPARNTQDRSNYFSSFLFPARTDVTSAHSECNPPALHRKAHKTRGSPYFLRMRNIRVQPRENNAKNTAYPIKNSIIGFNTPLLLYRS